MDSTSEKKLNNSYRIYLMRRNKTMPDNVRRGYCPTDEEEFVSQIDKLRKAGSDICFLIDRGYPIRSASVFVGNHYLLSERQRLALVRSLSASAQIEARKAKEITALAPGAEVWIDCFNTVITLEIAFSRSTLLLCMDGTVRDLAGLRGTYRLIDKTDDAAKAIRGILEQQQVGTAHFLLDAPVSNSGRLKEKLGKVFSDSSVSAEFEVINDVDRMLYNKENVITADAIILDKCHSWFNLVRPAIERYIGDYAFIKIIP